MPGGGQSLLGAASGRGSQRGGGGGGRPPTPGRAPRPDPGSCRSCRQPTHPCRISGRRGEVIDEEVPLSWRLAAAAGWLGRRPKCLEPALAQPGREHARAAGAAGPDTCKAPLSYAPPPQGRGEREWEREREREREREARDGWMDDGVDGRMDGGRGARERVRRGRTAVASRSRGDSGRRSHGPHQPRRGRPAWAGLGWARKQGPRQTTCARRLCAATGRFRAGSGSRPSRLTPPRGSSRGSLPLTPYRVSV